MSLRPCTVETDYPTWNFPIDVKYTAEYAIHSRLDARPNGNLQFVSNLCLCRILDHDFPRLPSCSMLTEDPTPGEKVYFGGYSSAPGTETVHKGMISWVDDSVREDRNGRANFKLDGTLVPGNLGGPVFIQREGEFRLAGIIITDLEDDFIKTKKELEPILRLSVNGASIDNVISTVVTTVFNNFSRGYGRAIHAKHVAQLLENNKTQLASKDPLFLEWYHEWNIFSVHSLDYGFRRSIASNEYKSLINSDGCSI